MNPRRTLQAGSTIVGFLLLVALAAPLLSNDKPIIVRQSDGRVQYPALADYPLPAGWRVRLTGDPSRWSQGDGGARLILPALIPYSATRTDLDAILQPPSAGHWMGTDALGRDIAARMVRGTVVSLTVGISAMLVSLVIGVILGSLAGYFGGPVDMAISRIIEVVFCFPTLFLILALVGILDAAGILPIVVAIGVTRWTGMARYVRGEFLSLRERDFVRAARAAGASHARIIFRYILPHSWNPVLVTAAFGVSGAVLLEAALSFLGFGIQPPLPTWGNILTEAQAALGSAWWLLLWPAGGIFLTVLGFNLLGEGFRDALDPRRGRTRS